MNRLALLAGFAAAGCSSPGPVPAAAIAITHVSVVDVASGRLRSDATVVVRGNRIASIGADSAPADARVVDGRGKFLIPGLWDMHVHAAWPNMADPVAELFVANGVTGVRDMWGDPGVIRDWRSHVAERDGRHPRIVAAGNLVDGPEPVWPNSIRVANADEARN
ncbi:MAG TPA: hypothetical protein VJO33_10985, partial [Gemmatimonadaceae bacterium]|nr:hypothetical protein [Gemmatimonadaceae bacterium]